MAGSSRDGRGRGRWDDWDDWDWEGWQDDKKEHSKARKAWGPRGKKSDAILSCIDEF